MFGDVQEDASINTRRNAEMSSSIPNQPSIRSLLEAYRPKDVTSWDLPPWGDTLSYGVYPLLIAVEDHFVPIGTAFCISNIGVVITATHNIEEALKLDRQFHLLSQLNDLDGADNFKFKDIGLSLLHVQVDDNKVQVNFRPLESGSIVRPTDVMFGFQKFKPGIPCLPLRISFTAPRIGSKVICLGYTETKLPNSSISAAALRSGEIKDWFAHYQHRFCAIEGQVTKIFTQSFAPCKGPCFAINAEVPHGLSGGPVFNEDGNVCGVASLGANDLHGHPIFLVSILYPTLMTEIKWGFSMGPLQMNVSDRLLDLIAKGNVQTDGSEEIVPLTLNGESIKVGLPIYKDDNSYVFDDRYGLEENKLATKETKEVYRFRRGTPNDDK